MIQSAIAKYIQDNGIATMGTDLFGDEFPLDAEDTCIYIQYAPSPEPNKSIRYYEQTLDIWSRSPNADVAYNKLLEIQTLLHGDANYVIDGFHVYLSYMLGSIIDADRDSQRRKQYKMSMRFVYRKEIAEAS